MAWLTQSNPNKTHSKTFVNRKICVKSIVYHLLKVQGICSDILENRGQYSSILHQSNQNSVVPRIRFKIAHHSSSNRRLPDESRTTRVQIKWTVPKRAKDPTRRWSAPTQGQLDDRRTRAIIDIYSVVHLHNWSG